MDTGWLHFCSILFRVAQMYVLVYKQMYRWKKGWTLFLLLLGVDWFLFFSKNLYEIIFVYTVTTLTHTCILRRKIAIKLPQYQIWVYIICNLNFCNQISNSYIYNWCITMLLLKLNYLWCFLLFFFFHTNCEINSVLTVLTLVNYLLL